MVAIVPLFFCLATQVAPGAINVADSVFTRILKSAIKVKVTNHDRIHQKGEPKIAVTESFFREGNDFRGGAIYCEAAEVDITQSIFEENTANFGGAIFSSVIRTGSFIGLTFEGQSAPSLGGSIVLDSEIGAKDPVKIEDVNFTRSTSGVCSALDMWGGLQICSYCRIERCNSSYAWPALRVSSTAEESTFTKILFADNYSRQKGCCIGLNAAGTRARFESCVFINNRQLAGPGTTLYSEQGKCQVTLMKCTIYGQEIRQFSDQNYKSWVRLPETVFIYDPQVDWSRDTPAPTMTTYCRDCPMI